MSCIAVLHVPHSASLIPSDVRPSLSASDEMLSHELLVMTDHFTDELFSPHSPDALPIRFPISRLVVDPERFIDDAFEPMAARGMGVIYTQTSDGKPFREPPSPGERAMLIERFYDPHHAALTAAITEAVSEHGRCLLLDCHSFPAQPMPCDLDQAPDRPDICLGTVNSNSPAWLERKARESFESAGFTVEVNRPYAGVLVPEIHTGAGTGVYALMIEVSRSLYMDERTGDKLSTFPNVAQTVQGIVLQLIEETRTSSLVQ